MIKCQLLEQEISLILFCPLFFFFSSFVHYNYLSLLLRSDMQFSFIQGPETVALSAITPIIWFRLPIRHRSYRLLPMVGPTAPPTPPQFISPSPHINPTFVQPLLFLPVFTLSPPFAEGGLVTVPTSAAVGETATPTTFPRSSPVGTQ